MKVDVYSLDGKATKKIDLPAAFDEEVREEIIKRAVLSEESAEYQPQGPFKFAGLETSAEYRGRKDDYGSLKNKGQAMLPREVRPEGGWGKVRRIPSSVKGRRAHPPKPEAKREERMNKKEYRKAMRSALAATANPELVKGRGHTYEGAVPLVAEDSLEALAKTKEVLAFLKKLVGKDIERARGSRKKRSGTRSRKAGVRGAKSVLMVVKGGKLLKAGRNIPGVDVVKADELKVKMLAPGTHVGRLTIYTEGALRRVAEVW